MILLEVKDYYLKNGYNIVAYTDHSKYVYHKQLFVNDFLSIAGFEASWTCLDPEVIPLKFKLWHINFLASNPGNAVVLPESFIDVVCTQYRVQHENGTIAKCADNMCPKEWFDYLLGKGIMPLLAPSLKEYPLYDLAFSYGSQIVKSDEPEKMLALLREKGLYI